MKRTNSIEQLADPLFQGLEVAVKESIKSIHTSLNEHIYETFNQTIPLAVNSAVDTASGWGAHRSQGGLYWATYKATVRRDGVFSGASGSRDFNAELFDPILRNLATGWERAFQRRLPATLRAFTTKTKKLLEGFHQAALQRAQDRHTNVAGVSMLANQIAAHSRALADLPTTLQATITDLQREASRQFTPVICEAMRNAYATCTNLSGKCQPFR